MLEDSEVNQRIHCECTGVQHGKTARTQGTLALSSGEAELYATGQGVSEALFLRSMLLEAKLAKKVNVDCPR